MAKAPHVLLVDDDRDFREITREVLKRHDIMVDVASNGVEALAVVPKIQPDIILMDVQMPKKDGIETTVELNQNPKTKHIKVIFLTNLGDSGVKVTEQNKKFCQEFGAVDYFKKGGDLNILAEKIETLSGKDKHNLSE